MNLHEMWGTGRLWAREELIKFWAVRVRVRVGVALLLLALNDTVAEICAVPCVV